MIVGPAQWLARTTWSGVLWWMRRPWIKSLRRRAVEGQRRRGVRGWRSIAEQDLFAMRYGRRVLAWSFAALLASIYLVGFYMGAVKLFEMGVFTPPEQGVPAVRLRTSSPTSPVQ